MVRRGQPLEGRAVLNAPLVERLSQVIALRAVRVLRTQGGQVVCDRSVDLDTKTQDRRGAFDGIAVIVGLHHELECTR